MSVAMVFRAFEAAVKSDGAALQRKMRAVVTYEVGSDVFTLDLKASPPTTYAGKAKGKADLRIIVKPDDFLALSQGKMNPQQGFLRGKIKIRGNMGLAMKLQAITQAAQKAAKAGQAGDDVKAALEGKAAPAPAAAAAKPPAAVAAEAAASGSGALFEAMRKAVAQQGPELVRKVRGVIAFKLRKPASAWTVDLKNGSGSVAQGAPSGKPDLVITMDDETFVQLAAGTANAQQLFLRGKLKLKGSMQLAMKLQTVIKAAKQVAKL